MKLLSHQRDLPFGVTAFQCGIGVLGGVAFLQVAMVAVYLLTVPSQFVSTSRYEGFGSIGVAAQKDEIRSTGEAPPREVAGNSEVPAAKTSEGTPELDLLGPLRSQNRAVRAMRFGVFIASILLCMLTVVALVKVNRLSHAKYAGRLWWIGLLVIPGWLLAGLMIAWNNELWDWMFAAPLG